MTLFKTYDCFPYDGEDILDLRLKVLYKHVDFFIIGESNISFSGIKKDYKFDINKFSWAKDKIRYYKFTSKDYHNCYNSWDRERKCRNLLINGLFDIEDRDRILLSDCDEIFDPKNLQHSIKKNNIFVYDHTKSHFYGDYICLNNPIYRHPVSFCGILIRSFELYDLRHSWRMKEKNNKKFSKINIKSVKNGGWHFSYLGSKKMIFEKISKFPEDFVGQKNYKHIEFLKKNKDIMIIKGIDIYFRDNIWGRVKYFHRNNNIVKDWFDLNSNYLSPSKVRAYGSITNILRLFYFLDNQNHIYIKVIKLFLRLRSKIFLYLKIRIF